MVPVVWLAHASARVPLSAGSRDVLWQLPEFSWLRDNWRKKGFFT